ncbi:TetR/AcrR family transcriptional regulator [Micromonospora echinospora]|uniref:TetR/AcrR family transcriptional regulator n=1 Tax=Micromonospora echinospora TaxID=1877 RepID=UPI00379F236E
MSDSTGPRPYHHGNLRTALLDMAEREVRERGADQLSLRDLARSAGVSHAAPRRHFPDRQHLLDALAEVGFDRLGRALRDALAEPEAEFPARVRSVVSAYVRFARDNAALLDLMHSSKHRPGATSIARAAEGAYEPVFELIETGQEQGALERGDPGEIGIVLFATVLGITAMVNGGMIGPESLDSIVETAVSQFLRGARPALQP